VLHADDPLGSVARRSNPAVGSADERGHHLEAPLRHVRGLAPEVGQPEVDVELQEVDAGGRRTWFERDLVGRTLRDTFVGATTLRAR
jgi:hypothetical protein